MDEKKFDSLLAVRPPTARKARLCAVKHSARVNTSRRGYRTKKEILNLGKSLFEQKDAKKRGMEGLVRWASALFQLKDIC